MADGFTPQPRRIVSQAPLQTVQSLRTLYPALKSYHNATLVVDSIHTLYYQEYGTPTGIPALFLHGGPGAGCFPRHAQFFDPMLYRIVLLDQRGSGQSTPRGSVINNTLLHLVQDCEVLRQALHIPKWGVVLGGSWGSTLALAYAQQYPAHVQSLLLRGVCLLRPAEVDWLFAGGIVENYSELKQAWQGFCQADNSTKDESSSSSSVTRGRQALEAHYDRLLSGGATRLAAARSWMTWEMQVTSSSTTTTTTTAVRPTTNTEQQPIILVGRPKGGRKRAWGFRTPQGALLSKNRTLLSQSARDFKETLRKNLKHESSTMEPQLRIRPIPPESEESSNVTATDEYADYIPSQAMLTCFYSVNDRFCMNNIQLLDRMDRIQHIPCIAVHGGRDCICPVDTALDVAKRYPQMELRIPVHSGHSMYDPAIINELVRATDRLGMRLDRGQTWSSALN